MSYGGTTESFGYDNDGLLTAAGRFTITRDAASGLPELVSANGFQMNRYFNGYGEVEGAETSLSGSSAFSYDLTRNNSGRITAKSEQISGISSQLAYTYDNVGRLLTVTKDGSLVEEYRYDSNGNRTYEMNDFRAITGRTFTHSDEDHTLTAGPISYEFDYDDNLTARREGTEITQYRYSSTGELQRVTLPDNTLIEYSNDPLGRRIVKKVNGTIEERDLWLDRTTLLAVYDGSNNLLQRFEYADDRVPYAMTAGGSIFFLAYDQVGSLRLITDNAGNTVKRVDYDSFGNIINDSNPSFAIPFGFAGGLHDRDTNLVRFGYRDYLPEIGKWTAKDPILFAGGDSNLYGYVQNDPVNWVDPMGLKVQKCKRPAQIAGGRVDHHWIKTDTKEAGMGPAVGNGVPGNQSDSPYISDTAIRDHSGESNDPSASCEDIPWADEDKVNELLQLRKPLGKWTTGNNCQTFAGEVLNKADTRPEPILIEPL